jgi:carbon monoxide dehydrogenase subunit G
MPTIVLTRTVAAPPAAVFAVLTDVARLPAVIPEIKRVEVLTPGSVGVGTRLRETRVMFGKEATETFEVTVYEPGRRFVMVADSCGVAFTAEHTFQPDPAGCLMTLTLTSQPRTLFAKLMAPVGWLMSGVMKKAIRKDLDAIAAAAEQPPPRLAA